MPDGSVEHAATPGGNRGRPAFLASAAHAHATVWSDFTFKTSMSKPYMLLIEPTLRCPMACKFCDLPTDRTYPKRDELPIARWKQILHELRDFNPLIRSVYISGGEPFLRGDLIELIEYAHEIGMGTRTLTIGWFCRQELLDRLLASPMEFLKFSLHSHRPDVHNALVGRDVYHRAVHAIEYLRQNGYRGRLGALCTVFAGNVGHLPEIAHFAGRLGLDYLLFRPLFVQTTANRVRERSDKPNTEMNRECVIDDLDVLSHSLRELKRLRRLGLPIANSDHQLDAILGRAEGTFHGDPGCHLMYESMYIKPNGNVDVCGHLALGVMGNLAHKTVSEVLGSREAYEARHAVTRRCRCEGNTFVRKTRSEQAKLALAIARGQQ